jgi:hypothetical protein
MYHIGTVWWNNSDMPIITNTSPVLDFAKFEEQAGQRLQHETVRQAARQAVSQAEQLAHPAAAYEWLPVRRGEKDRVLLGGVELRLGRHANLLDQAHLACAAVCTIGSELEEEAKRLMAAGRNLDGYMLGEAGVFALDTVMAVVRRLAEAEAAKRAWGVGAELAPGQLAGWALSEQKTLCSELDLAAIGVHLTDAGMLVPQKSASLVVGIGPDYTTSQVCSPCDFCNNRETCAWRH